MRQSVCHVWKWSVISAKMSCPKIQRSPNWRKMLTTCAWFASLKHYHVHRPSNWSVDMYSITIAAELCLKNVGLVHASASASLCVPYAKPTLLITHWPIFLIQSMSWNLMSNGKQLCGTNAQYDEVFNLLKNIYNFLIYKLAWSMKGSCSQRIRRI